MFLYHVGWFCINYVRQTGNIGFFTLVSWPKQVYEFVLINPRQFDNMASLPVAYTFYIATIILRVCVILGREFANHHFQCYEDYEAVLAIVASTGKCHCADTRKDSQTIRCTDEWTDRIFSCIHDKYRHLDQICMFDIISYLLHAFGLESSQRISQLGTQIVDGTHCRSFR